MSDLAFPGASSVLQQHHYWLSNAHVPVALLPGATPELKQQQTREGLVPVNLEIRQGAIAQITPAAQQPESSAPLLDLQTKIVFPCFVDMHTHLDKGHLAERAPNLSGTFDEALERVEADRQKHWNAEDVYRRMEFGLKCSYAHGTHAIRTHIDSGDDQTQISFGVFKALQAAWRDRLTLQAVCLVPLTYFVTPDGEKLADLVAEVGGILGGVAFPNPDLEAQLDRVFALAKERHLPLDFHTDESGDPNDQTLRQVAIAAVRQGYQGQIVCGHCCSLAVQSEEEVAATIEALKHAQVGVVSLPMCNLFLQDRNQSSSANQHRGLGIVHQLGDRAPEVEPQWVSRTPRWRGVTLLHELRQAGVSVAVASDNCRDPFFGFGDHDMLEVLTQSTRIAHFDSPYDNWCRTVTTTPADLMQLPQHGRIEVGLPADLVVFRARYFSELFSRPQHDRFVLREGAPIDTTLPDYSELDDL